MPVHSSPIIPFLFSKREVTGEGGLITGTDPSAFTATDPLRLWIVQFGIIISFTQLLSLVLRRLRQPKAIAEVLGGVLLGPSAFGRIPGFTEHIFPSPSLPYLYLVANIGPCMFLFLVGLAIDTNIIKRTARVTTIVSLAGVVLPFGLGSALSVPLYYHFVDPSVHFAYFMFFTGIAYTITAFPILCPILRELKLLDTHIGVIVLSSGISCTIIAWTLLALGVAFVNAASGLTALWILLVCICFIFFLSIPVKYVLRWLAHETGSIKNGPSMFFMTVVIILVWASCFFTDSIGVNAIFGAFLVGLIVPREGGLAITLTEKFEDIVLIVFLPLYFAFSGLNTDLGLLDNGVTWAFTIAIIALSFSGKFGSCTIASRLAGYSWRESSMIGGLMSCKGLVGLIVLNVGLQAGVLSQRVFSMFVLEALTLTLVTTPLATTIYPPRRHIRIDEIPSPSEDDEHGHASEKDSVLPEEQPWRHRFTVVLNKLDHIPSAMALTQLVLLPRRAASNRASSTTISEAPHKPKIAHISVEALQLIELSDRTFAMMQSSTADNLIHTDPMLSIFRMFGELNGLTVKTSLSVVPLDDFARSVAEHAHRNASHLILLPLSSSTVVDAPNATITTPKSTKGDQNAFEALFGSVPGAKTDKISSAIHSQFVRGVFAQSKTDIALFIDTDDQSGFGLGGSLHLFLPFFGGPDDRLALEFVVQLCLNPRITATVLRIMKRDGVVDEGDGLGEEPLAPPPAAHLELHGTGLSLRAGGSSVMSTLGSLDRVYDQQTTQTHLQSETADNIAWSKYVSPTSPTDSRTDGVSTVCGFRQAVARIHFSDARTPAPVQTAVDHARTLLKTSPRLLIVAGRSQRPAQEIHRVETKRVVETSQSQFSPVALEVMRKTIGDIGAAMMVAMDESAPAMVVLQAAHVALD